ncbi:MULTISPECIES: winged helix-turn-helix domain-containing protein [unclassified Paenibacillus]|uniref:winged helix-turn-helix domain-containing protein n=1 Tax=unclassified Paenibacillus TaxID=185978 RepID=UPI001C105811|nr:MULTISPECIES: crosslink repair DNA glycosylase YcaQ family protein [unclassified Paenibacillus]MBU5445172.1 winged helix DNA-binding domain-containing protein [Paenibacillus sp. MSJ-34]CAH0122438.1 hypothetical protein PAE9249_04988 [Paenibacillus sp. CECT 9249]
MAAITLTKREARKFLVYYHGLYGEFDYIGKDGVMAYIRRAGCIQFDPLNVVGMNPELVLQSRVKDFDRSMLWDLLYKERKLIDYWDKNMSIFPLEDWPYFLRCRNGYQAWCNAHQDVVDRVYAAIEQRGHLSSGDLDYSEKVDWAWGPTRLSRAALEGMYHAGLLAIHHKEDTRKYYDLTERLIPEQLHAMPDPFETDEQYYEWYVYRRIGSVGLLWNKPSDAWLGIRGMKSAQRNEAFRRLIEKEKLTEVHVEGLQFPLYIRSEDLDVLHKALSYVPSKVRSSILAPLDNMLWDRGLIKELFDFEYRWEVYKPVAERKYGYYVLPVLYDDKIVARFEPAKQRKNDPFSIQNWWWEEGISVNESMQASLMECFERFAAFLGTHFYQRDGTFLR